ncbi:methyl-accepting chemotaxis protein [Lyngbya sp. PCC 8106]|uniref:methyl-accepting chemotaxis protein n=1 Tax=Lyngbya sp. (strain PCC 8106) TaxID=313612 RepID=UPI0000EACEE6|nr:methyl-accepting chemotaxis protein [Lyngbya sp. PCC 8106]EAW36081.1 methyl-accepting chemotaxis protein [Lyngbya sp. PCC 8106]
MFDLTGFFEKLQNKFLALLIISTVIPVSILAGYGVISSTEALTDSALNRVYSAISYTGKEIENFLEDVSGDVLFLSNSPTLVELVQAENNQNANQQNNLSFDQGQQNLQTLFFNLAKIKPNYLQIRYLDEQGNEIVRVDSEQNKIDIITDSQLQNKADRDYFMETIKLKKGEVYVSEVNLNRERGQIEVPYKPVIRYATPIYDQADNKQGIIIINVNANAFISMLQDAKSFESSQVFMINADGYYLQHPNPDKTWGFELNKNETVFNDYPTEIVDKILSEQQNDILTETDSLIGYYRLFPNRKNEVIIISKTPDETVFASVTRFKQVAGLIVFLGLVILLTVQLWIVQRLINMIKELVRNISFFSTEVVSNISDQENMTNQQVTAVNQTTVALDELNTTSRRVTEQAVAACVAAQQALALVQDGVETVKETHLGISTLEEKVIEIAQKIAKLQQHTYQISTIVQIIRDISYQTNMLALNAAVEAVRAGEQGKGFGLVASEIRILADKSSQSVENINLLVDDIQQSIQSTVKATKEGTKTARNGVLVAQATTEAFSGVAQAVNEIVMNNQSISQVTQQQAIAIEQILTAMTDINTAAKHNASRIRQTRTQTENLNNSAVSLKTVLQ